MLLAEEASDVGARGRRGSRPSGVSTLHPASAWAPPYRLTAVRAAQPAVSIFSSQLKIDLT